MGMTDLDYSPVFSTHVCKTKEEEKENTRFPSLFLLILGFTIFLFFVSWYLFPVSYAWIFKSVMFASLLVYYSWELIYFDSLKPGTQPASPPHIRLKSGHTFHINYILTTFVAVFLSLFIGWFI